ncbi:hypothetical protein CDL15_Pgr017829 [Punica granatum]|uniref:Uncharacterized protein n=1 Tax=Punica granatum TaxID=22663 RepID=A0A218WGZ1_PUNGR|nr:hypothetical protein CDL15_Pgr017829 [Punica granatum]
MFSTLDARRRLFPWGSLLRGQCKSAKMRPHQHEKSQTGAELLKSIRTRLRIGKEAKLVEELRHLIEQRVFVNFLQNPKQVDYGTY